MLDCPGFLVPGAAGAPALSFVQEESDCPPPNHHLLMAPSRKFLDLLPPAPLPPVQKWDAHHKFLQHKETHTHTYTYTHAHTHTHTGNREVTVQAPLPATLGLAKWPHALTQISASTPWVESKTKLQFLALPGIAASGHGSPWEPSCEKTDSPVGSNSHTRTHIHTHTHTHTKPRNCLGPAVG